jgi:sugar phosphate isomerase/epimerase
LYTIEINKAANGGRTMTLPIIMHVNYCEQGQTLDEICQKAVDWGYDGVEFRRTRAGANESPEEYLDNLAGAVRRSGLKEVIFGSPGPNLVVSDAAVRENEIQKAVAFFRMASQRFKLTVCNTMAGHLLNPSNDVPYFDVEKHGSFIATEEQWQWISEGFKVLGKLAEELGFKFAFETHMNIIHDTPDSAMRLVSMVDSTAVGINFDYGNLMFFKNTPPLEPTIDKLKESLYYVHLKNYARTIGGDLVATALGDGDINNRQFLKSLRKAGYNGPLCIEAPRAGDREHYAQQDIAYLKDLLEEIGW